MEFSEVGLGVGRVETFGSWTWIWELGVGNLERDSELGTWSGNLRTANLLSLEALKKVHYTTWPPGVL